MSLGEWVRVDGRDENYLFVYSVTVTLTQWRFLILQKQLLNFISFFIHDFHERVTSENWISRSRSSSGSVRHQNIRWNYKNVDLLSSPESVIWDNNSWVEPLNDLQFLPSQKEGKKGGREPKDSNNKIINFSARHLFIFSSFGMRFLENSNVGEKLETAKVINLV